MADVNTYNVVLSTIGHPTDIQKLIFNSVEELQAAKKDISDGKDIFVKIDDTVILIHAKDVTNKIYESKILLGAKVI